jgi:hypothetical protein
MAHPRPPERAFQETRHHRLGSHYPHSSAGGGHAKDQATPTRRLVHRRPPAHPCRYQCLRSYGSVSISDILFTFIAGWTNHFTAHLELARWVFPLWLYVAITGPICYWMLRPYYGT